jgi:hypothetical protein
MEVLPLSRNNERPTGGGGSCRVDSSIPSTEHEMRPQQSHQQKAYRIHFSVIDRNRSWIRGTKRSIRWYVVVVVVGCISHLL